MARQIGSPGLGDWGTDLYGAEGQPVRPHVPYASGALGFNRAASSTSCGQSLRVNISVNGTVVGWLYFAHLNNVPSGPITNNMIIGTMHSWDCNPGLHTHVEFKNTANHSCYVDRGNPGVTVDESQALGVLGSTNTGPRQNCAGLPETPSYPEAAATPGTFGKGDLYFVKTRNTPSGNVGNVGHPNVGLPERRPSRPTIRAPTSLWPPSKRKHPRLVPNPERGPHLHQDPRHRQRHDRILSRHDRQRLPDSGRGNTNLVQQRRGWPWLVLDHRHQRRQRRRPRLRQNKSDTHRKNRDLRGYIDNNE